MTDRISATPCAVADGAEPSTAGTYRSIASPDVSDESVVSGLKLRSKDVTEGDAKAGARAMLRAVGMTDDDWDKPQVAVASSWNEVTPCNMPLDRLAKRSKEGV